MSHKTTTAPPPLPTRRASSGIKFRTAGLLLLFAVAGTVLFVVDPASSRAIPACPSRLVGVYCPGCGTLRATHALLHGRFLAAVTLNPLYLIVLPVLGFALARQCWRIFTNRPAPPIGSSLRPAWIWGLLTVIGLYAIARNLPWFPFTLLAPAG